MPTRRVALLTASIAFVAAVATAQAEHRSAYSYVREVSGDVTVVSGLNGTVEAARNLPISPGDELRTDDPSRAEVALADGNVLHVGGGTSVQFVSLYAQQGSDDEVSAISLREGSVVLSVLGSDDKAVPRLDTDDVTVYTNSGSRVRVNADPRRGTAVIVRAGSVEVRSPLGSYTVRAGNYLLAHGDEEPEIARGTFSRDRFDSWAA
ncbi:MAG TPA: FecR domain-containing protein, partial [Thermoanaerobaculia bacterium]